MEEDELCLPADTLQILNEFLLEKTQREQEELKFVQNKAGTEAIFEEDWQLSQFWYSESTKEVLGRVITKLLIEAKQGFDIALLSCPSLYGTVKKIHERLKIFEYDTRFAAHGDDFVFYDINAADELDYLKEYEKSFDLIIADPPFLSEECIMKISKIIRVLQKPTAKIIFCSGAVVEPWLAQHLEVVRCNFQPEHERNLGNEFVSFANFKLDEYIQGS